MTILIDLLPQEENPYRYNYSNVINKKNRGGVLGHRRNLSRNIKREILERDKYTCQICGGNAQAVDHIIAWRLSNDNSPNNLRALCRKCNIAIRLKRRDARKPLKEWYNYIENELRIENLVKGAYRFAVESGKTMPNL